MADAKSEEIVTPEQRVPFKIVRCDRNNSCTPSKLTTEIRSEAIQESEISILWSEQPKSILFVKKFRDPSVSDDTFNVITWMCGKYDGLKIYVEPAVRDEDPRFSEFEPVDMDDPGRGIDFIVCIGGDGTLLYITSLFQRQQTIPPVACFARGSLGFLTPFSFKNYKVMLSNLMQHERPLFLNVRERLRATVSREGQALNDFQALNEVLIHRDDQASLIQAHLLVDDKEITVVQADGLIISTPTGSTAYSVSAGGSLIAPNVPCIAITPICPHTLSFRPFVVSDTSKITVHIPEGARFTPLVSFDGKNSQRLEYGDDVYVERSDFPLATFKHKVNQEEWFEGLVEKLHWNVRMIQKSNPHL